MLLVAGPISAGAASPPASLFAAHCRVTSLDVADNCITDVGAAALIDLVKARHELLFAQDTRGACSVNSQQSLCFLSLGKKLCFLWVLFVFFHL